MARLIFEKGVVEERADLNPVTGRWRVVYEQQGEGARFKQLLDEGDPLPGEGKGLKGVVSKVFTSGPAHLVYAVSKERLLMLEFPRRVAHQNQVNHFDLNFKVEYHVTDPRSLVERLRVGKEDPLERLRDAVGDEIGGACKRVAWDVIRDEYAFAQVVEDLTSSGSEVFRKIQGVARYLGLAVTGVKLSLRLLEKDVQEWRALTAHELELAKRRRDLEVKRVDEDIRDEETKRALLRETWKGGVEALNTSVKNIGRDTDSAAKLRENLETLGSLFFPQMGAGALGSGSAPPQGSPKLLADSTNVSSAEGLSLMQRIMNQVIQLDLAESDRKHLLAAVFHLSGELLARDEDRPDALSVYQDKYRAVLDELLDQLTTQQHKMLELLLEVDHL